MLSESCPSCAVRARRSDPSRPAARVLSQSRNFALSRSCDLPRVCRICGAPALPKECNNGLICRECYNKHRREQQYHKRHEPTERMAKTCKYCGAPAMGGGRGAICRKCYNIRQNDRYPYIRTRKYETCRILRNNDTLAGWYLRPMSGQENAETEQLAGGGSGIA